MLKYSNGEVPANYNCKPYLDGVNRNWTQDYARKALRWERRVEFAMEGQHFFDIVRCRALRLMCATLISKLKKLGISIYHLPFLQREGMNTCQSPKTR